MKIFYTLALLTTFNIINAQIQDTTFWKRNLQTGLNINQTQFSEEWKAAQGGMSSAAISIFLFGRSNYVKYKNSILNDIQLQYGRDFTEANLIPYWRKNLDRIFFDNKYAYGLNPKLGLFVSVLFQSQFDNGYSFRKYVGDQNQNLALERDSVTLISSFLAPGYLDEAIGLEWTPLSYFSARFGPVALRQTFQINDQVRSNVPANYGVLSNRTVRNQIGLNMILKFDKNFNENINLKLIYQYFSAYDNLEVSVNRLDAILTAKIIKYININLQAVAFYNQDQVARMQYSQALALGIVYNFEK
jgi:hypothetical protein